MRLIPWARSSLTRSSYIYGCQIIFLFLVIIVTYILCNSSPFDVGIKPFVTIFHWDVPQILEDEYGGFLSSKIVFEVSKINLCFCSFAHGPFRDFADVCFKEFGDRVKHCITLNEPWTICNGGYVLASLALGQCSAWQQLNCIGGNSATEPYIVGHNQLLADAAAVKLYRDKYRIDKCIWKNWNNGDMRTTQKGVNGITLASHWFEPYSDAKHNLNAVQRALDFMLRWFLDPITHGNYPHSMRSLVGNRLPKFTEEQSLLLKGSFDFLGLYAHYYVNTQNMSYITDALTNLTSECNGIPIGPTAASSWLSFFPSGIRSLLLYVKNKYKNPLVYITENGVDEFNNSTLSLERQLADPIRIDYYYRHLRYLLKAIKDGVNVKGYFAWSLLDNFEWGSGYTVRFGINYVDYKNGLKRYPKHSSICFKSYLNAH